MKNTEEKQIIKRLEKSKADIYFAIDKYLAALYDLEFLRSQSRAKDFDSWNLDRAKKLEDLSLNNTRKLGKHILKGREF